MFAYKFTTHINTDGTIRVPAYLRNFNSTDVEVIMLMPEQKENKNTKLFFELIDQYNAVSEDEIDITAIYKQRETANDHREFDFN
jgi:hypothetical protein